LDKGLQQRATMLDVKKLLPKIEAANERMNEFDDKLK